MEKVVAFNIKSALGSFLRPQSNNNPSTFHIIPKSAVVGIIGAVIGLERDVMRDNNMYKFFTEKLKYSVIPRSNFQIKYWSEYSYIHGNVFQGGDIPIHTPRKSEKLVNISYDIYIKYSDEDADVKSFLQNFTSNIKENSFVFPPYMGMANFPADITYIGEYVPEIRNGKFTTNGICTTLDIDDMDKFRDIGIDDIPTQSISYLAHHIYKTIYFHKNCGSLQAEGNYYAVNEEALEFI